jgi:Flp pilus assembly protein TadG
MRGAPQTVLSRFRDYCRECEGSSIVEFAIVGPLLIALLVGVVWLGALVNHYITLTDAVSQGARAFAESTNITTAPVNGDPCTYAQTVMNADAASLNTASITYTITYTPAATGVGVAKGASCAGFASSMVEGDSVTIQASYPALGVTTSLDAAGLPILTHLANWTLNAHTTQVVQ